MFAYLTMLRRMLRLHKRLITVYMQTSINHGVKLYGKTNYNYTGTSFFTLFLYI